MKIRNLILAGSMVLACAGVQAATAPVGCNLAQAQTDKTILANFNVSTDPAGLALEANANNTQPMAVLSAYANANHCTLYALSVMDLVNGLLKGSTLPSSNGQSGGAPDQMKSMSGKFILIYPKKAMCISELGLQIPVKTVM